MFWFDNCDIVVPLLEKNGAWVALNDFVRLSFNNSSVEQSSLGMNSSLYLVRTFFSVNLKI